MEIKKCGHLAMELAPELEGLKGLVIFGAPPLKLPLNMEEAFLRSEALQTYFTENPGDDVLTKTIDEMVPDEQFRSFFKSDFLRTDPVFRSAFAADIGKPNALGNEAQIDMDLEVPIYFIHDKQDVTVNLDYIRSLRNDPQYKIYEIDNCGHYPSIEQPEIFNSYFENILGEVFV